MLVVYKRYKKVYKNTKKYLLDLVVLCAILYLSKKKQVSIFLNFINTKERNLMSQIKKITAYDFTSFLSEFQTAIQEGYALDTTSNENYPQIIGIVFTAGLTKVATKVEAVEVPSENTNVETQGKEEQVDAPKARTSIYKPKKA